jgi:hypothetical protein
VSNSVKAAIVLCFASLFWSGNFVIGRLASVESLVSPLSLGFYRWVIAFLILTPFCISKAIQDLPLLKKQPIMIFLIILTGPTLFNTLVYLGLTATTVINALLIISTTPMLIILFNRIIYKIDTNAYQMIGVAISLVGVSYVVVRGNYQNIFQSDFYSGDIFIYGRSDATLNPGGVRIGTSEIYNSLQKFDWIIDSLATGYLTDNDEKVILFLKTTHKLPHQYDLDVKKHLKSTLSPRHVPWKIFCVSDIPRTKSGKNSEILVKKIINNDTVQNLGAIANSEVIEEYKKLKIND